MPCGITFVGGMKSYVQLHQHLLDARGSVPCLLHAGGLRLVRSGFTRAKNTGNILMKNMMDFCIGTPCYWIIGFGLMFGGTGALIGGFDRSFRRLQPSGSGYPAVGLHRVPDRVLRNGCHHRFRLHGRAHQLQGLLRLFRCDLAGGLPHLRPLDVGRRLAAEHGLP